MQTDLYRLMGIVVSNIDFATFCDHRLPKTCVKAELTESRFFQPCRTLDLWSWILIGIFNSRMH